MNVSSEYLGMSMKDMSEVVLSGSGVNVHHVHDEQGSHDSPTDLISPPVYIAVHTWT